MFKKEGRNLIENNALNHTAPLISGESRPSDGGRRWRSSRPWDNLAGEFGLQKKVIYCLFASRATWKPFYRRLRFWVVLGFQVALDAKRQ